MSELYSLGTLSKNHFATLPRLGPKRLGEMKRLDGEEFIAHWVNQKKLTRQTATVEP